MSKDRTWKFDTRVIHTGQSPEEWQESTLSPIYQTAAHKFETAQELSDVFAGKEAGFIYLRLRNPTNEVLERKIAALEGGVGAVGTSSGMAAVTDTVMAIAGKESPVPPPPPGTRYRPISGRTGRNCRAISTIHGRRAAAWPSACRDVA